MRTDSLSDITGRRFLIAFAVLFLMPMIVYADSSSDSSSGGAGGSYKTPPPSLTSSGTCVICFYADTEGSGHGFVKIWYPDGSVYGWGFYPSGEMSTSPAYDEGTVMDDSKHMWHWRICYIIPCNKTQIVLNTAAEWANSTYVLIGQNCVSFVQDVADNLGIDIPDTGTPDRPEEFAEEIEDSGNGQHNNASNLQNDSRPLITDCVNYNPAVHTNIPGWIQTTISIDPSSPSSGSSQINQSHSTNGSPSTAVGNLMGGMFGIVCGLEVNVTPSGKIHITPGMGIDSAGKLILMDEPVPVDLDELLDGLGRPTSTDNRDYNPGTYHMGFGGQPLSLYGSYSGYSEGMAGSGTGDAFSNTGGGNSDDGLFTSSSGFTTWVTIQNVEADTYTLTLDYYDDDDWTSAFPKFGSDPKPLYGEKTGFDVGKSFIFTEPGVDSVVGDLAPFNPFGFPSSGTGTQDSGYEEDMDISESVRRDLPAYNKVWCDETNQWRYIPTGGTTTSSGAYIKDPFTGEYMTYGDYLQRYDPMHNPTSGSTTGLGLWSYGPGTSGTTQSGAADWQLGTTGDDFTFIGKVFSEAKDLPTSIDNSFSTTTKLTTTFDDLFKVTFEPPRINLDTSFGTSDIPKLGAQTSEEMWGKVAESLFSDEGSKGSEGSKGQTGSTGFKLSDWTDSKSKDNLLILITPKLVLEVD